jgi:hypothetical protein
MQTRDIEKEFIPYKQALALKELGFDEPCLGRYWHEEFKLINIDKQFEVPHYACSAPLYQQAFRWFREKYPELDFAVGKIYNGTNNYHYHINLLWEYFEGTYEEAELECLKKLIEIVKTK